MSTDIQLLLLKMSELEIVDSFNAVERHLIREIQVTCFQRSSTNYMQLIVQFSFLDIYSRCFIIYLSIIFFCDFYQLFGFALNGGTKLV